MSIDHDSSDQFLIKNLRGTCCQQHRDEVLARLLERSNPVEETGSVEYRVMAIGDLKSYAFYLDGIESIEEALRVRNFIVYLEGLK